MQKLFMEPESCLNDIAMIRSSFDITDLFPPDDPILKEIAAISVDARRNLVERFRRLVASSPREHDEGFKTAVLKLIEHGHPRRSLDGMMKLDVFCSVGLTERQQYSGYERYLYEFNRPIDRNSLLPVSASEIEALLLADILENVETDSNYTSRYLFDRNVSQKYIAYLFAIYAGLNPMFYDVDDPDGGSGAGVPRRPLIPQRSGGAAKPLPEVPEKTSLDE